VTTVVGKTIHTDTYFITAEQVSLVNQLLPVNVKRS
jgi:hypothetical protein